MRHKNAKFKLHSSKLSSHNLKSFKKNVVVYLLCSDVCMKNVKYYKTRAV